MVNPAYSQGGAAYDAQEAPEITYLFPGDDAAEYQVPQRGPVMTLLHVLGGLASLAVIVAGGWWGYQQIMRDVNGVPVVRALDGPIRIAPDSPGGEVVDHAGLAVNTVQAVGVASAPEASMALAPAPVELAEEDQPVPALRARPRPAESLAELTGQAEAGDNALVLSEEASLRPASLTTLELEQSGTVLRPQGDSAAAVPGPTTEQASLSSAALLDAINLAVQSVVVPAGTRLVQLGAYDSHDAASHAWDALTEERAGLMEGKEQIVLEARAEGRTFWRLRAMGFEDLEDAREFCAELANVHRDCIPVTAQ